MEGKEIKLEYNISNSLYLLDTELGNKKVLFLIDTGANISYLTKPVIDRLNNNKGIDYTFKYIGDSTVTTHQGTFKSKIGCYRGSFLGKDISTLFQEIDGEGLDTIEVKDGRPVEGIIGLELLKALECIIDFNNDIIKL